MTERDFGNCDKCGAETSVSYHGPQYWCHPIGSNDPCWTFKLHDEEHFLVTCRRCHYRRAEGIGT